MYMNFLIKSHENKIKSKILVIHKSRDCFIENSSLIENLIISKQRNLSLIATLFINLGLNIKQI